MPTPRARHLEERQLDAVVGTMRPLSAREELVVRLVLAQGKAYLRRDRPDPSAAISPEDLVLFAAYNAATLVSPRCFLAGALGLTPERAAAFCARIRGAAELVASRQGRRGVLDRFRSLDAVPRPDRASADQVRSESVCRCGSPDGAPSR